MYDHVKSMNSVTDTVYGDTVKNVLLTDIKCYSLIYRRVSYFASVEVLGESSCL